MSIKLVIFDFDGVLVDSEFITGQITCEHLSEYGHETDLETVLKKYVGMHDNIRRKHLAEILGEHRVDRFMAETKDLSLLMYEKKLSPLKNVEYALENLRLPICIASNSRLSSLKQKLSITKLNRFFHEKKLFVGGMVENPKPAPDIYLLAAEMHNVEPHECLVIEDSVHGINAAVSANMRVIGYYGASHCYEGYHLSLKNAGACALFNDMVELPKIIKDLSNANL